MKGQHYLVSYHYENDALHPSQVKGQNSMGFKNRIFYSETGKVTTITLVHWDRLLRDYYTSQHSGNPTIVFTSINRLDD